MKLGIPRETRPYENRVAATPDTVKKLIKLGFVVTVEAGAGISSSIADADYEAAGATIAKDAKTTLADAQVVLKVQQPQSKDEGLDEIALIPEGATLISLLNPYDTPDHLKAYAEKKLTTFAMELVPRITRAQSMDVLSSQSNLAGYKAVLDALEHYGRAVPMMMTAAGTVAPAKICIIGAGVAGLQAIATAKRLGGVVSAFDVRAAAKEQVQSLGATFVEVDSAATADAETAGGYAKEMSGDYKQKQAEVLKEHLKKQDIVITTALIPGKPAPRIITADMVAGMKAGSVIVDLAVERGGNTDGVKLAEIVVTDNGVKLVGHANVPSRLAADTSALYAKNLLNFVTPLVDQDASNMSIDWNDEIVKGSLVTRGGEIVNEALKG